MATSRTKLSPHERRTIALLGLPSFGLALGITVVVAYVPVIAHQFTSSTAIVGLLIAAEGMIALFLPVLVGTWSDHLHTRLGGRLPFLIAGLPVAAVALVLIGFAHSMAPLIIYLLIFFVAYYLAYEPYRALYPDLIKDEAAGRAQSIQALWRGLGTGLALAGGAFLLALGEWPPFVMAAGLLLAATVVFLWALLSKRGVPEQKHHYFVSVHDSYAAAVSLFKSNRQLRYFVVANSLWELSLAALKSFILLYLTVGLGKSRTTAATFIAITAAVMFVAAPFAGKLGDMHGKGRLVRVAAAVFGLGMMVPAFSTNPLFILPILPVAAFGGAVVLTLPYALLMPMMPEDQHGKVTGIYSTSRGAGIVAGPLLAGGAISLLHGVLPAGGYGAMWLVCGGAMLLSLWPLRHVTSA
jgi:MFS family permease